MYRVCHSFAAHRSPSSTAFLSLRRRPILSHGSLQRGFPVSSECCISVANVSLPVQAPYLQRRAITLAKAVAIQNEPSEPQNEYENATLGSDWDYSAESAAPPPEKHRALEGSCESYEEVKGNENSYTNDVAPATIRRPTRPQSKTDTQEEPSFQGFWSLQRYHEPEELERDTPALESVDALAAVKDSDSTHPLDSTSCLPQQTTSSYDELWNGPIRSRKIDFSYWNVFKQGQNDTVPETISYRPSGFIAGLESSRDRRMTKIFMQHFFHDISAQEGISDQKGQELLNMLKQDYGDQSLECVADILTWSWILLANPSHTIKRLLIICEQREKSDRPPVPLWLILQVLRGQTIDATSLERFVTFLTDRIPHWNWQADSVIVLTVRLLRHARLVASACIEPIVSLFLELLELRFTDHHNRGFETRTAWCNRVLTLLSIASTVHPFRMMKYHQAGQLTIIQYMQDHKPQIPILREGYRAIAKLQLMHAKTEDEKEWARAKSLTWPPWEKRHQMGALSQPRHYPGKSSRVLKVLKRMQEAGYAPYGFDLAMQILAGWDTDWSPTVQVARPSSFIRTPSIWESELVDPNSTESDLVWSARVEATRTVREAWMCFCSYTSVVPAASQSLEVYRAMFRKLFAKKTRYVTERGSLPGDGRETYSDPELARDQVYIPEAIPSVEGLFSRMTRNHVQPDVHLLSELLFVENDLQRGLRYIASARIEARKREVLQRPQEQTPESMACTLRELPDLLFSAYVQLLARPNTPKTETRPRFGVSQSMTGAAFVKAILTTSSCRSIRTWNWFWFAMFRHCHGDDASRYRLHISDVWFMTCDTLDQLWATLPFNFETLKWIGPLAFTILTDQSQHKVVHDPVVVTKRLFTTAAHSISKHNTRTDFCNLNGVGSTLHSIPDGDSIEIMAWVLGAGQQSTFVNDMVQLLRWSHFHRNTITNNGQRVSKHNLAAFRVFLENMWDGEGLVHDDQIYGVTEEEYSEIRRLMTEIGEFPDDEYMQIYLAKHRSRVQRLRNLVKARSEPRRNNEPQGPT